MHDRVFQKVNVLKNKYVCLKSDVDGNVIMTLTVSVKLNVSLFSQALL